MDHIIDLNAKNNFFRKPYNYTIEPSCLRWTGDPISFVDRSQQRGRLCITVYTAIESAAPGVPDTTRPRDARRCKLFVGM